MISFSIFKGLWRQRAKLGDNKYFSFQRQFLPAALEVEETPPSPVGRGLCFSLIALFSAGLLWACFGEVDIVVTAHGKIIPSGKVKIIQPLEAGTVREIYVKDGDTVKEGQPLISLDPTYAEADSQRVHQQIASVSIHKAWRDALEIWLASDRKEEAMVSISEHVGGGARTKAEQLYRQQRDEINARVDVLQKELSAALAEQRTALAELEKVEMALPILSQRVAAYKHLHDQKYGAKVQYLEILQQQVEMQRSIPALEARSQQLAETVAALAARIDAYQLEQRKNNLLEIWRLENEIASLLQEKRKAVQHQSQQLMLAPVSGTVQQLAIHTVGGVVTPAQELMKIVPAQASMEIEALVQNKDIGFIDRAQTAEIKVDAFNFTKFGVIQATIKSVARDAVADDVLGWVFPMQLLLEKETIDVAGKEVRLSPGMSVIAEVKTGKRRLIEFFLSPLLRYGKEGIRER